MDKIKKFDSIQDLWSYCLFCPVCRNSSREVQIAVGPDDVFLIDKFEKTDSNLILDCIFFTRKQKYFIKYNINCNDNSFISEISDPVPTLINIDRAPAPYFYFYLLGACRECNASYINGADIELNLLNKTIFNIGVEIEGVYLLKEKSKFHIIYEYDNNNMIISRCYIDQVDGRIVDENKPFHCPVMILDFSNQSKAVNRLKTILVFS
jgi:hypothetical protein